MTQPMPGKPAEDAEMNWIFVGCFVPCGLGSYGLLHGAGVCVNRAGVYFFCSTRVSATAITDRPTVNMLGGYYSRSNFCVTWMPVQTWLLPTNHGHGRSL